MHLVNCRDHGRRPPPGAVYIGRAMPGIAESPLANPYTAAPKTKRKRTRDPWTVEVPRDKVLEYFRRRLTGDVVAGAYRERDGGPVLRELHRLTAGSRLACWCTARPAVRVGPGQPQVERACHGDVIFSAWLRPVLRPRPSTDRVRRLAMARVRHLPRVQGGPR
jgi:hypothetical protein